VGWRSAVVALALALAPAEAFADRPPFSVVVGHNWSVPSRSTVELDGAGYDLTLSDVRGHDQPYFDLPLDAVQFSLRFDVALSEHYALTIGLEHMKYVVAPQEVRVSGSVDTGAYVGDYEDDVVHIGRSGELVGWFEHSDGVNYVPIGLRRLAPLGDWWLAMVGIEGGPLVLNTDTQILGRENDKKYHLGGFALSAVAAVQLDIGIFFLEADVKGGRAVILDALSLPAERAEHAYWFVQGALGVGLRF
jgi:hypothetical protein